MRSGKENLRIRASDPSLWEVRIRIIRSWHLQFWRARKEAKQ